MTFWERLESALDENNCTMADLGRKIQLSPTVIFSWKTRGSIPRADIACKTAKALNTTVEYLINGTETEIIDNKCKSTFLVPVLNQELSAGKGEILPEDDFVKALIELPTFLREYGENLAGLYVHGDSMEPTLKNGDLVICNSLGWEDRKSVV